MKGVALTLILHIFKLFCTFSRKSLEVSYLISTFVADKLAQKG